MGLLSGKRPTDLGVKNGNLRPPPSSPNAVSSQATGGHHQIAPLRYEGTREHAMKTLRPAMKICRCFEVSTDAGSENAWLSNRMIVKLPAESAGSSTISSPIANAHAARKSTGRNKVGQERYFGDFCLSMPAIMPDVPR